MEELLLNGTIHIAQLHGQEGEREIRRLRELTDHPLIQAFRIDTEQDVERANASTADYVLLDSGAGGTGTVFDWDLLQAIRRPYFLAGGLDTENLGTVKAKLNPYGIDVSSGIETDGLKDKTKMAAFVAAVSCSITWSRSIPDTNPPYPLKLVFPRLPVPDTLAIHILLSILCIASY